MSRTQTQTGKTRVQQMLDVLDQLKTAATNASSSGSCLNNSTLTGIGTAQKWMIDVCGGQGNMPARAPVAAKPNPLLAHVKKPKQALPASGGKPKPVPKEPTLEINPFAPYPVHILRLLSAALIWPKYEVRKLAIEVVKKLSQREGPKFRTMLAECFSTFVNDETLLDLYNNAMEAKPSADSDPKTIHDSFLTQAVRSMLTESLSDEALQDQYMDYVVAILFLSSAPVIASAQGNLWVKWISTHLPFGDLVHSEKFCDIVFNRVLTSSNTHVRANVIRLLLSIHFKNSEGDDVGAFVAEKFWTRFTKELYDLDRTAYADVTPHEVGVFKCPEGTLYNQDVIDQNSDLNLDSKNIKRESKAYSHKDQLAEIELRRALAEKNRLEGKLTERQKKAVDAELKTEKEIRDRIRTLYEPAERTLSVLAEAARYNPQRACYYVNVLYDVVVPLLKSPLVAVEASQTFLAFSDAFFEPSNDSMGTLVGLASLRVLGALNYVDIPWVEPMVEHLERVFKALSGMCIYIEMAFGEDDLEDDAWQETISAWKLSFMVPLIELLLPSKHSVEFKLRVSSFLKAAVSKHFLSNTDAVLPPIARLHSFLVKQLCADPYAETFEDIKSTISSYCCILQDVEESAECTKRFLLDIVQVFKHSSAVIRLMAINWLQMADSYVQQMCIDNDFKQELIVALYLERFDSDENCADAATALWDRLRFSESKNFEQTIFTFTTHEEEFVQDEAAEALYDLCTIFPDFLSKTIAKLFSLYDQFLEIIPPELDRVGRVIKEGRDPVNERLGIGKSLARIGEIVDVEATQQFVEQIADRLSENAANVHSVLSSAAISAIKTHGQTLKASLLPMLEEKLSKTPATSAGDKTRQGLVVLMGTLGMYLGNESTRVVQIFKKLIEVLATPSEQVQRSVAECIPQLVGFVEVESTATLESLMKIMEVSTSYGERRGAAYGIAAIITGLRTFVIVEMGVMQRVEKMVTEKKNFHHRESALLIMEMIFKLLGKSAEPFFPAFIPYLLVTYGDSSDIVRKAAADTGHAMMAAMSRHGAKLIVPLILKATENDNWRTKRACAELLGAMSRCAPRQLSSCLPKVVPALVELLADSHTEVQKAGIRALKEIAKVIRNPEIMAIAPHLISGLTDPVAKTTSSLETVVNTRFIHYMDPPSLALIMPILKRAVTERNTDARRMSAQIVASIYSLTDRKDMEPYLPMIIPSLQSTLLDPVPEVRTVAARAFGAVLRYSDEDIRAQVASLIVPWLKERLVSETSMVDRSGAAQGMSEVIAAFGEEYLDACMPEVIAITENPKASIFVRDGHLLLFIYLPIVLRDRFVNYLASLVPSLLISLSDENEIVRTTALRAGQRLIDMYVGQARTTLLPQLQKALFHSNWRIRHASVQLIGDYLFNVSGVSGKMTSDTANEDDTLGVEAINKAIMHNLGREARDQIFSGLYLCRQDVALIVRQAASHVWKVVVPNTPRTLRDIMETLFSLLLDCLAHPSGERRQTAGRCLGEIVKKMGERLLGSVLPILKENLSAERMEKRLGVAEALNEVLNNCSREVVTLQAGAIMVILNRCLSDSEGPVRAAAAPPFNTLMQIVGPAAVDEIVIPMVTKYLETSDLDTLDALCMIVSENPRSFLPPILAKLTKPPIKALGLCRIAAAAGGSALNRHLPQFLEPLLAYKPTANEFDDFLESCMHAVMAITEVDTMNTAVKQLFKAAGKGNPVAMALIHKWVEKSELLFEEEVVNDILPAALALYGHESGEVVDHAVATVAAIIKGVEQGEAVEFLGSIRRSLQELAKSNNGASVKAFEKPLGFAAFQIAVKEALFSTSNGPKEAAIATCDLVVRMSTTPGIAPHTVFMAGPLVRSIGDRFLTDSRPIALSALNSLFEKAGAFIRPFVPQIHTELLKLLQSENVSSMKGIFAATLAHAICLHVKSEAVFNDLVNLMQSNEDSNALDIACTALQQVVNAKKNTYSSETVENARNFAHSKTAIAQAGAEALVTACDS